MVLGEGAGDCLEAGYDPPQSVVVLLDSELAEREHTSVPSVRMPRGFELVWKDEGDRADRCLSIWRPVPFPGCAYSSDLLKYSSENAKPCVWQAIRQEMHWRLHGLVSRHCAGSGVHVVDENRGLLSVKVQEL